MPTAKGSSPVIGFTRLFRLPSVSKYARGMDVEENLSTVRSTVASLICLVTSKIAKKCQFSASCQKERFVRGLTRCCVFNTPLLSN